MWLGDSVWVGGVEWTPKQIQGMVGYVCNYLRSTPFAWIRDFLADLKVATL